MAVMARAPAPHVACIERGFKAHGEVATMWIASGASGRNGPSARRCGQT